MKSFALRQLPALRQCLLPAAIATLLTCASAVHAESAPVTDNTAEPVTSTMHKLAGDVEVLLPLIYQFDKATTPADKALINEQITKLLADIDTVAATVAPRADTYQISYQALATQLQQAQQELASGRTQYGMTLLRSATSVCATCHTQDDRATQWMAPTSDAMKDPYIAGEYLFMTRQYDAAFEAYASWLRQQKTLSYEERTRSAFERLLLTSLQMQKSPTSITEVLTEFTNADNINGMLRTDLSDWIIGIAELQQLTDITVHPQPDVLKTLATEWLRSGKREPETRRPQIVWLRGELYRALINETDRTMIADWLYWLALSDRALEYRFFYSLADMYLRQCMLEYTDDPMAQSCYREYENYIEFFYSGSSGTHIPDDISAELKTLKAKVFSGKAAAGS